MFRMKLTLLYFFTIVLVVAVMWVIIDDQREKYIQEQLYPSLASASASYEAVTERRVSRLKEYAESIRNSDLSAYVQFLNESREEMRNILTRTRQEFPEQDQGSSERQKIKKVEFVYEQSEGLQARFGEQLSKQAKKSLDIEGGYAKFVQDYVLSSCLAEADPWSVCYFKLIWLPLTQIVFPVQKKEFGRAFPELFVLVDDTMTTRLFYTNLKTAMETMVVRGTKDNPYSDSLADALYKAGLHYRKHTVNQFMQRAEVLDKLEESPEGTMLSSFLTLDNKVYVVVAARLDDPSGKYLGAVLVGYEVGTGVAWEDTAITLGIRPVLQQCLDDKLDGVEQHNAALCENEMSKQENGVTYLLRNKKGQTLRAGTSLPNDDANRLTQDSKDLEAEPSRTLGALLAKANPVLVEEPPDGESLRAILTVDVEAAVSMFHTMKVVIVLLGILVFLVGMLILQLISRSFAKPFERIDAGVHEIIGGNFEYTFPFNFREELPRSMAQSLTIMKAVLLGLPLPEDQERDDSWASNLRIEGEAGETSSPPVDEETGEELETQAELGEVNSDGIKESATEYYRRLFREYTQAKQKLGEDTSKITYIKFVEKIAKTEKALREKYEVKQILLRVETKDTQVVLVPLKVVG
jgi:hypothetical protein